MAEITALGATLLHSLWQATALAVLLWCSSRYVRLGAADRYRLAYSALLLQLLVSVLTFLHYYRPAPHLETTVKEVLYAYVSTAAAGGIPAYDRYGDPAFWMQLLVAGWLLGVGVGSFRLLIAYRQSRQLRSAFRSITDATTPLYGDLYARVKALASVLGYRGELHLRVGKGIGGPMLVGHLRPVLLFPVAIVNQLTMEETETIILHELAHLRRYDHYFNLLQCLIEVAFYYHPAVHWIGARIREEREYCCDDLVLAYGPGHLPYARALLHYGEQSVATPRTALSLTDGGGLLSRVTRFLNHQEISYRMKNRLLLLPFLALLTLIATAAYSPDVESTGTTESPPLAGVNTAPATPPAILSVDTLPDGKHEVTRISDGKVTKLRVADGEIEEFTINGRRVPRGEFSKNEALAEEILGVKSLTRERLPEGWGFDFSPDSLHRLAAHALASVDMDAAIEVAGQYRFSMENYDFDSLRNVYGRLVERVDIDSLVGAATDKGQHSLDLDSVLLSWGSDTQGHRQSLTPREEVLMNLLQHRRTNLDSLHTVRLSAFDSLPAGRLSEGFTTLRSHMKQSRELQSAKDYLKGSRDGTILALRHLDVKEEELSSLTAIDFSDATIERLRSTEEVDALQAQLNETANRLLPEDR